MALVGSREVAAIHAAGKTIVLLDEFKRTAEVKDAVLQIFIYPFDIKENSYCAGTSVSFPEAVEEGDSFARDLALIVANGAAEHVVSGLKANGRSEALKDASFLTDNEGHAKNAFECAVNLLEGQREELDRLIQGFRHSDQLTISSDKLTFKFE